MENGRGGFLRKLSLILLSIFVLPQLSDAAPSIMDIWRNNQAAKHMEQKKAIEAHEEFTQLLSEQPFNPVYQYNMGSSFLGVEEKQKALQMYEEVLKLSPLPPEVEFASYYNLGILHSLEGGDIDKALSYYQKALAMNPDSIEIKTNIELLFKGGKGGGKGKNDKDKQNQEDQQDEGEQPKEPQNFTNKQQPNQFNSKEMSKGDVKKILEELKKQEQKIRAKHDRKGKREADRDKNW